MRSIVLGDVMREQSVYKKCVCFGGIEYKENNDGICTNETWSACAFYDCAAMANQSMAK
jgi:hypothetical protein